MLLTKRGVASRCAFCGSADLGDVRAEVYCRVCGAERTATWNMTDEADWTRVEKLRRREVTP